MPKQTDTWIFDTYGFVKPFTIMMPGGIQSFESDIELQEGKDFEVVSSTLHNNPKPYNSEANIQMEGSEPSANVNYNIPTHP